MAEAPRPQSPAAETEAPSPLLRGSPRAQAAAALMSALGKAARAFTLYDPANTIVRKFIEDYRAAAEAATAMGPVAVDVKPFELMVAEEVIYREEDRERSLAFKLFRDGVRKVTYLPGVDFRELLMLLQILAIRYAGVRQSEDDVVTLLKKAEMRTILVTAVEGYAPDEEEPEEGIRPRGGEPPPDFDQPFPKLPPPGPVAYRPVPDEALAPLRAETTDEALARSALQLAAELMAWAARSALPVEDAAQYCSELRDFLVAEHDLNALAQLADLVQRQPPGPLRDGVLRGLADARLVEAVLAAAEVGGGELPPAAARLVPFVPAAALLDRIPKEEDPARLKVLLRLAGARLPADAEAIARGLAGMPAEPARALFRAIAASAPEHADRAANLAPGAPGPGGADRGAGGAGGLAAQGAARAAAGAALLAQRAAPDRRRGGLGEARRRRLGPRRGGGALLAQGLLPGRGRRAGPAAGLAQRRRGAAPLRRLAGAEEAAAGGHPAQRPRGPAAVGGGGRAGGHPRAGGRAAAGGGGEARGRGAAPPLPRHGRPPPGRGAPPWMSWSARRRRWPGRWGAPAPARTRTWRSGCATAASRWSTCSPAC
ncbi:MAG: hypothetical protein QM767_15310 [Anaeromyxobacter sp.]